MVLGVKAPHLSPAVVLYPPWEDGAEGQLPGEDDASQRDANINNSSKSFPRASTFCLPTKVLGHLERLQVNLEPRDSTPPFVSHDIS